MGAGAGANCSLSLGGRRDDLYARLQRRPAADRAPLVCRATQVARRRRRCPARADHLGRVGSVGLARHRCRSLAEPRAHPALESVRHGLEGRPRRRPGGPDPRHSKTADRQDRRRAAGKLLSGKGPLRPGDAAQQSAGLARLLGLAHGRTARHPAVAVHLGRQTAAVDPVDRPPVRLRADVLPDDPVQRGAGLDAEPVRHVQPAGAALHGRGLWVLSPHGQPAHQDANAHVAQASPGVRPGRGAGHAKPGRSGLQGTVERRHLVPWAAANRAGQSPGARRARGRFGCRRRLVRSQANGKDSRRPRRRGCS